MAYSARINVVDRLAALPAENEVDTVDSRVDAGIEYADAVIDGKLAACYSVPFTTTPKLIKNISADLAAAFTLDGGFSGGGEDEPTKLANSLRKRAMDLLQQLVDKELLLPAAEAPPANSETVGVIPNHSHLGQRPSLENFDLYSVPPEFY